MTVKTIRAPGRMDMFHYGPFLASCADLFRPSAHFNRVTIDLSDVRTLSATGLALLTSTMLQVQRNRGFDRGRYLQPKRSNIRTLLVSLGFVDLIQGGERGFAQARDRLKAVGGVINVTDERECEDVAGWLAAFAFARHQEREPRDAFQFCCTELLDNVFHHAYSPTGAVACAHMDEQAEMVELAIVDTGIGILQSFRSASPSPPGIHSDEDAVKCALMPEISSKPYRHSGVGLFFTRKIAVRSGGLILLHSGACAYIIPSGEDENAHSSRWPGTLVSIRIPRTMPHTLADIFSLYKTQVDIDLAVDI